MFGDLIEAYLFLGGTGGGACVVIGILGLLTDADDMRRGIRIRFRDARGRLYGRFFVASLAAALCALAIGVLCLLADMGRPDRALLLITLVPSTYLGVGSWALLVCAAVALWVLLVWCGLAPTCFGLFRALHTLLATAGFIVSLYTGLLLSSMPSVPLWNSPWLAAVFTLSGLSCGLALVLLTALATDSLRAFSLVARRLVRTDTLVIFAEGVSCVLWVASVWLPPFMAGESATATDVAALVSLRSLCTGSWALGFWLGLVVVGLALPALLELVATRKSRRVGSRFGSVVSSCAVTLNPSLVMAASLCVLVGGACLRYLVVAAAVFPVPLSPL